jgi:hypothetical protein
LPISHAVTRELTVTRLLVITTLFAPAAIFPEPAGLLIATAPIVAEIV